MKKGYETIVCSDTDYENLVVEIVFQDKNVIIVVSQERNCGEYEIGIFPLSDEPGDRVCCGWKNVSAMIALDEFMDAITDAKSRLQELGKSR